MKSLFYSFLSCICYSFILIKAGFSRLQLCIEKFEMILSDTYWKKLIMQEKCRLRIGKENILRSIFHDINGKLITVLNLHFWDKVSV